MAIDFLHNHKDFRDLIRIIENAEGIEAGLIEKDYWIMHVLYGLKQQGFEFELKGGTSLSKGYKIIHRFSEDIDIHIVPPEHLGVEQNPNKSKEKHINSRKNYYDWLAEEITIEGITNVSRDLEFDDPTGRYRSGGIRLSYTNLFDPVQGLKEGILLEAGFDTVTPNVSLDISSWAWDYAKSNTGIAFIDNRATNIICYHPGYTFVEKLQTIATKYRLEQTGQKERANYMRQYYDVFCCLDNDTVLEFIGSQEYQDHKKSRFPKDDYAIPLIGNQAFLLETPTIRERFEKRYEATKSLYYKGQPSFDEVLARIAKYLPWL